jgi:hypothetical protein
MNVVRPRSHGRARLTVRVGAEVGPSGAARALRRPRARLAAAVPPTGVDLSECRLGPVYEKPGFLSVRCRTRRNPLLPRAEAVRQADTSQRLLATIPAPQ